MLLTIEHRPPSIPADELARILALHEDGQCFRAYELAKRFGELARWRGTNERLLAGRLAPHLGAPRLALALHHRAWRDDPTDPWACFYRARLILGRRGPLEAWRFVQRVGPLEDAPDQARADWMASHSCILGRLRDFDAAESWLARAERLCPGSAWLLIERSDLYELEDRYPLALAAAREALELKPWYRPGVQAVAHLLELLDRQAEAVQLLAEASERIESALILAQQGALEENLGRFADAQRTWDRFASTAPLLEREMKRWLAGRRCDAAYGCGDMAAAAALARESKSPFFEAVAGRLENPEIGNRRVRLDVGFVRQHHQTCARRRWRRSRSTGR